jgi:hypothetical protein
MFDAENTPVKLTSREEQKGHTSNSNFVAALDAYEHDPEHRAWESLNARAQNNPAFADAALVARLADAINSKRDLYALTTVAVLIEYRPDLVTKGLADSINKLHSEEHTYYREPINNTFYLTPKYGLADNAFADLQRKRPDLIPCVHAMQQGIEQTPKQKQPPGVSMALDRESQNRERPARDCRRADRGLKPSPRSVMAHPSCRTFQSNERV